MSRSDKAHFQQLLARYAKDTATAEERAFTEEYYAVFEKREGITQHFSEEERGVIEERMYARIIERAQHVAKVVPMRTWILRAVAVAAMLVLVTGGAWFYFTGKSIEKNNTAFVQDVKPGRTGAILKLSNGEQVLLDTAGNGRVLNDFSKKDGTLTVEKAGVEYATLETPMGRTMQLTLSDGSVAWLNAGSSIRFPTVFTGNTREVTITGEAYFEVAKNKEKPFIVVTRTDRIEVMGTHFNINSYVDEGSVKTTLLEGAVKVSGAVIKPGEQYNGGNIAQVNTDEVVAWKNGFFSVHDADIKTVMRQLARWYDVEVSFEGELKGQTFSGEIDRNLSLSRVLDGLSDSHVKFRKEGDKKIVIIQ